MAGFIGILVTMFLAVDPRAGCSPAGVPENTSADEMRCARFNSSHVEWPSQRGRTLRAHVVAMMHHLHRVSGAHTHRTCKVPCPDLHETNHRHMCSLRAMYVLVFVGIVVQHRFHLDGELCLKKPKCGRSKCCAERCVVKAGSCLASLDSQFVSTENRDTLMTRFSHEAVSSLCCALFHFASERAGIFRAMHTPASVTCPPLRASIFVQWFPHDIFCGIQVEHGAFFHGRRCEAIPCVPAARCVLWHLTGKQESAACAGKGESLQYVSRASPDYFRNRSRFRDHP